MGGSWDLPLCHRAKGKSTESSKMGLVTSKLSLFEQNKTCHFMLLMQKPQQVHPEIPSCSSNPSAAEVPLHGPGFEIKCKVLKEKQETPDLLLMFLHA